MNAGGSGETTTAVNLAVVFDLVQPLTAAGIEAPAVGRQGGMEPVAGDAQNATAYRRRSAPGRLRQREAAQSTPHHWAGRAKRQTMTARILAQRSGGRGAL